MTTTLGVPATRAAAPAATGTVLATVSVLAYVLLWLGEGALRKWVPSTGSVMYVARDAVLLVCIATQLLVGRQRVRSAASLPFWLFTGGLIVLAALQLVVLGLPVPIALLGLRNYLAPVAFVYFFWRFWRSAGPLMIRLLLIALPVQLAIAAAQVVSPASAFVNLDVSGEGTALGTANGVVRASGTFSDAGTLASFAIILFALCLGLLSDRTHRIRPVWLVAALAGDLLMIAISGERTAVFGSAGVLLIWLIREILSAELRSVTAAATVLALAAVIFFVALAVYPTAISAFGERFVTANSQEDSVARVVDSAVGFLTAPLSPIGTGIGSRSNAAVALGAGHGWIETELTRWVAELGLVGLVLAFARTAVGVVVGVRALLSMTRLPALAVTISAVVAPQLVAGSIGVNPAVQGAAAVSGALLVWTLRPPAAQARMEGTP